ncbi:coiled-coil domain-containing protein 34 isoform X2 [Stigmatopora argus]
MAGWCPPSSAAENFSSTPLKPNETKDVQIPDFVGEEDSVLEDDDDTYSLVSPIYHDSYKSDEDDDFTEEPLGVEGEQTPSEQLETETLSPWQKWLVNKCKEEQAHFLKEKEAKEEMERQKKKILEKKKIRDWQQLKREQERQDQLLKSTQEETETRLRAEKQKETEKRAQQKYKDWLQKKKQERLEKEKKQKELATLKEEQEQERRRKADQNFKEWLAKNEQKLKASPKTPPSVPFLLHPPPGFYNPIPWKPIHTPPPEWSPDDNPRQGSQKGRGRSSYDAAFRISQRTYR